MKKILSFLIILGAITFINIDLFASSYNDPISNETITLDSPIVLLNNYTLNELFYDFNSITNGDFNNGLTSWTVASGVSATITDDILVMSSNSAYTGIYQSENWNYTDTYYIQFTAKGTGNLQVHTVNTGIHEFTLTNQFEFYNIRFNLYPAAANYIGLSNVSTGVTNLTDKIILLNLSTLNLTSISNDLLEYYYSLYRLLKVGLNPDIYYDQGYDNGYLDGYDDGLVEGYYNGQTDYYNGTYLTQLPGETSTPYNDGQIDGYQFGYNDGYNAGVTEELDTNYLLSFVQGSIAVLGAPILPNITLGVFVFVPLFFGFIAFLFRLGGKRG